MLKTSGSTESLTQPGESVVGVCGDSRAGHDGKKLDRSELNGKEVHDVEVKVDEVEKKVQETFMSKNSSKSQNLSKSKKAIGFSDFFTLEAKLVFTELRQVFLKASILHYFNLEHHIRIETDVSGYAFGGVLSQLILDNLGQ